MDDPVAGGSGSAETFVPIGNPWRIKHPVVTFFHLLFRTLALIGKYARNIFFINM